MDKEINNTLLDNTNARVAGRIEEKRNTRDNSRQTQHSFPYADMANNLLFQQIAEAICPEDLKQEFTKLGLNNVADVASYRSQHPDNEDLPFSITDANNKDTARPSYTLITRAQREARRIYRVMQHMLAVKDPMNQSLRHTTSHLPRDLETAYQQTTANMAYANPSSLQSNQSTAAYLRHLYRIATGMNKQLGIKPPQASAHRLENRRPDLTALTLSEANLKRQIPTIDIINHVLEKSLERINERNSLYPIALPFDEAATTVRAAINTINGLSLNAVNHQTRTSDFPLQQHFRLAGDVAGLLGLQGTTDTSSADGSVMSLLTLANEDITEATPSTLTELYNSPDRTRVGLIFAVFSPKNK